ncbi:uncharacterized protein LOC8065235 [Sorghum bicolor]|nr:uncharacterized protein LOC8065235 [Sorghum bicolor]|eukprot:XP_002442597.1 uncharacterized protein LOC8065235 [Sorghum bicolor]
MDSDQDSVDDWVVLASSSSSSDDEGVIALSSGCTTPNFSSRSGSATPNSDPDHDHATTKFLLAYEAAAADPDDPEGMYDLSDAEDTYATPPPSPPLPKPLSGLFHHTLTGDVAYAAFDPVVLPASASAALSRGHYVGKQLVPDPTFASFIPHEPVSALASTRGLVCLRGTVSNAYYVANPATFEHERLPKPASVHTAKGEPAVVIAFDLDPRDSDPERADAGYKPFYRHYHVVVAFPIGDGIYSFESFSSRTGKWTMSADVTDAGFVHQGSGVGVLGCAFWRTSMGLFLCYEPVSRCADLVHAPEEVMQWHYWELGEMEGTLCVTCMDELVEAVVVIRLEFARHGAISWALTGHFEGGCLRGRKDVKLLRSQGKAEVVMWDPSSETVVAMDIEGRTTRTIRFTPGSAYYADFIPYVRSLAAVSANGKRAHAERSAAATNNGGGDFQAEA